MSKSADHGLPILGIPCFLESAEAREAVRVVLEQIRERCPEDFSTLKSVVQKIVPLPPEETASDGTLGHWVRYSPTGEPILVGLPFDEPGPGELRIAEVQEHLVANIAHELGHACTTSEDVEKRGEMPEDEWASELTADWYADKKWGFGAQIEEARPTRPLNHHGPAPGDKFTIELPKGVVNCYEIDENYKTRLVKKVTPEEARAWLDS
jgi:hypothetical protein